MINKSTMLNKVKSLDWKKMVKASREPIITSLHKFLEDRLVSSALSNFKCEANIELYANRRISFF